MSDAKRKIIRVRDVMTQTVIMMDGMETVKRAIEILREQDARCVVIRKRHEDDEFGIVLLGDLAKQVIAKDRSPERVNLYEVMSKPVISVRPEMDIRYTARLFERFGLSQAPVIEGDTVVGLATYAGIVLHGLADDE